MIFDLQLFVDSPSSGINLGSGSNVIDIGTTGGIGNGTWVSNTSYAVGFKFDSTGKKSGLAISETESTTGAAVNYLDVNGNGEYDKDTEPYIVWNNEKTGGSLVMQSGSVSAAFSTGGSLLVTEASIAEHLVEHAWKWDDKFLTAGGWSTYDPHTSLSSDAATGTSLATMGFSSLTLLYGNTTVSVAARAWDVNGNHEFDAGDVVTNVSGLVGAGEVQLFGMYFGSTSTWTGLSVYGGTSSTMPLTTPSITSLTFYDVAAPSYSSDYTHLFDSTGNSILETWNENGAEWAAATSTQGETIALTQNSIEANGQLEVKWDSTVSTFMWASSDTTWESTGKRLISNLSLTADLLYGDTQAYTFNIDNGYMSEIALGGYQANLMLTNVHPDGVTVTGLDSGDGVHRTITYNSTNDLNMKTGVESITNGAVDVTTGKYTAQMIGGTVFNSDTVVGSKDGKLTFKVSDEGDVLNFGEGTDSVTINAAKLKYSDLDMRAERSELITVNNLTNGGTLNINGLKDASNVVINGTNGYIDIKDSDGQTGAMDTLAGISIIGGEQSWNVNRLTGAYTPAGVLRANLGGKGIEYVDIYKHGAAVVASDWVFANHSVTGAKGDNILSIGTHGILDIEGGIYAANQMVDVNGDGVNDNLYDTKGVLVGTHMKMSGDEDKTGESGEVSTLAVTSAADSTSDDGSVAIGDYEVMKIKSHDSVYSAMVVSGAALSSEDKNINWNNYDIIVGEKLDLTGITDKKVVYLNNNLDKTDWGETLSYSANMTSVISSSVGGSLIIGDYENKVNFYATGDLDSLFGGYSYDKSGYDTLASAGGKKAWMGSSDFSGQTKVELLHNGSDTYNFGFVDEFYSVSGTKTSGTETDDTADVLTLMNGMGVASLQGSEHSRANLIVGADAANNFTFQSISEGVHDVLYTFELGRDPQKARVDTSLVGSTANFDYQDDVAFYLGFDNGTVLTMNSDDSGKMVNYGGTNVIQGVASIDGSAAAGGNILNGQNDHAEYIIASNKTGDTLCGGLNNSYTDEANDTLVGGAGADTFWVGDDMGNDVINNLTDGDTIVFLGSKFADATLNYENERMVDYADSHWMTVTFEGEDGTTKISITPGDGVTKHMSDLKNVTAVFDDGTYTWNGQQWTQA